MEIGERSQCRRQASDTAASRGSNGVLTWKFTATGLATAFLMACGGGAAPTPVAVALQAEVCTEGDGPESKLYIRNLDDYEWRDITCTLMKGEGAYTREWPSLLPESQRRAEALHDSLAFKWDSDVILGSTDPGGGGSDSGVSGPQILRLRFFTHLDSAKIEINSPQPGEWTGAIQPCQ